MSKRGPLKSVRTAFDIMEVLVERDCCGVSELSDILGRPTSTVHEYLRALEAEGCVVNDGGVYSPSSRFLSMGVKIRNNKRIYPVAKPELQSLAEETGAHVSLTIEENGYGIPICIENMSNTMRPIAHTGMATYLHVHAAGKAILADLPVEQVEEIIDRHGVEAVTENTIADRDSLLAELEAIRERGYAVDSGEAMLGVNGIGVSILDRSRNEVLGGLGLYMPAGGNDVEVLEEEFLDDLLRVANTIEVNLLYD